MYECWPNGKKDRKFNLFGKHALNCRLDLYLVCISHAGFQPNGKKDGKSRSIKPTG